MPTINLAPQTPSEQKRKMAYALLQQGMSGEPVRHWTQGLARMLQAAMGGYGMYREDEKEEKERAEGRSLMEKLPDILGGGATAPLPLVPSSAPSPSPARAADIGDVPLGSSRAADDTQGPSPQRAALVNAVTGGGMVPASIRTNNPGAQWPGPSARAFASTGEETIGGGNRIATFDTPEQGAAAQFHLLNRAYAGMPLSAAVAKWSGGNNAPQYTQYITQRTGLAPDTVLTPELLRSPQGVALVKAMAQHEAGQPYPLSDTQWTGAQRAAFGGGDMPQPQFVADRPSAPPPQAPQPGGGGGMTAERRALIGQLLNNRYTAPLGQQLLARELTPETFSYQTMPDGTVMAFGSRSGTARPVYRAESKPTYGVIGEDQFGNKQYGWVDPYKGMVRPERATGQGATDAPPTITGPGGTQIQVQPGQDPKIVRELATKAATTATMPASDEATQKVRKEVQDLPSYKNLAQAAPVYKTMVEAAGRDNRAADVNLIYGMAKIMDPGSVVRESEMSIAQAVATMPQNLQAQIKSQLSSTGRLDPEVRASIMQEARSRILAYQGMFEQDAAMYRGIAQRGRMNVEDVLPSFGPFDEFKPPQRALTRDDLLSEARRRGLNIE